MRSDGRGVNACPIGTMRGQIRRGGILTTKGTKVTKK